MIGVGPGASDLLTLRAVHRLREAQVVFYPVRAEGEGSIALDTVLPFLPADALRVELVFPMVKDDKVLQDAWERAAKIVEAHSFERAVFVTVGDPSLYCTYFYIHPLIEKNIDVEFVPGVISVSACCASLGIPLVLGGETLLVFSGAHNIGPLDGVDSVVVMKIPKDNDRLEKLIDSLKGAGFSKIYYASRCQTDREMKGEGVPRKLDYMSMIIAKK